MDFVDWKMIDIERRLMDAQCIDKRPGLSEFEMRLASGAIPEARGLLGLYRLRFGEATGARADLASQFVYAQKNLEAAIRRIVRSAPGVNLSQAEVQSLGRAEASPRPLSQPDIFFLGAYTVTSSKVLTPVDAQRVRVHLLKSFWKNGVRFAPSEVSVSLARAGTDLNPRSEMAVVFPVRNCFAGPAVPQKRSAPARPRRKGRDRGPAGRH